jgi:hypothetical protein
MKRSERLLRIGEAVLARPNGLRQCANSACGLYYRPSYDGSTFCPVCIKAGAHLQPRFCAYARCGVKFQPRHETALYHSDSCRQLSYRDRKEAKAA